MSVFLSDKILTRPSVLALALALELARKGKLPLVYSMSSITYKSTFGFKLFFSVSYRCNFRVGVYNTRDGVVVNMRMLTSDALNCENTLILGFVGQHGSSHHITNSQNVLDVGLEVVIDNDSAFIVDLDASLVEVEPSSVGSSSSGDQDMLSFESLFISSLNRFNSDFSMISMVLTSGNLSRSHDLDALFHQDLVESFGDFFIDARGDLIQKLDNSHVSTHSLVNRGHFQTNDTTSDDDQIFGDFGDGEGAGRADDNFFVKWQIREAAWFATSGNNGMFGLDSFFTVFTFYLTA